MKHTFRKCLSFVLALATLLSVCVVPLAAVTPETCDHYAHIDTWTYIGYTEPTCTAMGGHAYLCGNCESRFINHQGDDSWEPALNHKLDGVDQYVKSEEESYEATLTAPGLLVEYCALCNHKKETITSATKCEDGCDLGVVSNTATCDQPGVKREECKKCPYFVETNVPALGHAWDKGEIVVFPVCGTTDDPATAEDETVEAIDAEILFTCTREGCEGEMTVKEISPENHKWIWHDAVAAGCGTDGNTAGYTCEYCDAVDGYSVLTALPHIYEDYDKENWVEVGCTDGVQYKKCSRCQDVKTINLTATEHGNHKPVADGGLLVWYTDHTCKLPGFLQCTSCLELFVNEADPAAHNWTVTVAATCYSYGYRTCGICGETQGYRYLDAAGNEHFIEEFNKKPHTKPTDETQIVKHDAECEKDGWIEYACQTPGCPGVKLDGTAWETTDTEYGTVQEYTEEKRLGHAWEPIPAVPGNCTTNGTTAGSYCPQCNTTVGCTNVPAPGHNMVATKDIPANCQNAKHDGFTCSVCGYEDVKNTTIMSNFEGEKDVTKHVWDEDSDKLINEPTCEVTGTMRRYCKLCGLESAVEIEALNHQYTTEPIGIVPATCSSKGYAVYACTREGCTAANSVNHYKLGEEFGLVGDAHDRYETHAIVDTANAFTYDAATGTFTVNYARHDSDNNPTKVVANDNDLYQYDPVANKGWCNYFSYYKWTCQECNYNYSQRIEDQYGPTGDCVIIPDASKNKDMDCSTNTPGWAGATCCARCERKENPGYNVPVHHNIDSEVEPYFGETAALCDSIGWDEKGYCVVCQNAEAINGLVNALGHKNADGEYTIENIAASKVTCYTAGWDAHWACTQCEKVLENGDLTLVEGEIDEENSTFTWVLLPASTTNNYEGIRTHSFATATANLVPYGCMVDGYTWKVCIYDGCSEIEVSLYYYGYANHRYDDLTHVTDIPDCSDRYCLCQNEVQIAANGTLAAAGQTVKCGNKNVVWEGTGHQNAAGEAIHIEDCALWDKEQEDNKCDFCKETFTIADVDHHEEKITSNISASCISYAYTLCTCTRCGEVWTEGEIVEVYGPHKMVPSEYVAPTWTTDGYKTEICSLCGHTSDRTPILAPDMFFDMSIDNIYGVQDEFGGNYTWNSSKKVYEKTNDMQISMLANGSFVAVTIYATGSATNFTSIDMSIPFDPDALQFSPAMTEKNNDTLTIDGKEFVVAYNGAFNSVEIFINAAYAADRKPQNAELTDRTALITLYFQINPDFYDNAASVDTYISFGEVSVLAFDREKNTTKDIENIVLDTAAPVAGYPEVNGGAYVLTVYKLGDLNGDGVVTDADAILVEAMAFDGGYDAQADIDKDGDVDLVDFMYMKQYLIKVINYPQLAAKLNVATDAE